MRAASLPQPPAPRPGGVVRQGLLDGLDEGLPGRLVVVAPAGVGTSLLRDWWLPRRRVAGRGARNRADAAACMAHGDD